MQSTGILARMSSRDWGQLLTAMVTPFNSDNTVNLPEAARIARYLIETQRNDGLVIAGTTGESPTLSDDEKIALLDTVLESVGDRAAIIMGTGSYDTAHSIHLTRRAESSGAHGIMLVNPYYSRPGQRGLIAHFKATAEATRLPVMLYNIQPRSAINLETESLLELAEVPNIAAVKEASGNLAQISDVIRQVPPGFRVYSGDDGLTLSILALGGHGLVSVAAHHIGSQLKMMITSFESDPGTARQIHHKITPFIQAIFSAPSPVPIKFVLANQGFDCERVRLPLVELNPTEKDRIASTLNAIPS